MNIADKLNDGDPLVQMPHNGKRREKKKTPPAAAAASKQTKVYLLDRVID